MKLLIMIFSLLTGIGIAFIEESLKTNQDPFQMVIDSSDEVTRGFIERYFAKPDIEPED